ncbi:MAG: class I SAM-dependent methyltransferase [Ardenticatenaceae bacterium]|nr:class I SAM-dependent methyltransferase [Ardenticatenaceae bacterium]
MRSINLSPIEKTMIFTLRPRAEEHARPDRLFDDPQAASWFAQSGWPSEYEQAYGEKMQNSVAIRVKTVDDAVERFMATHDAPLIVELGAGLSTRATRLQMNPNQWVAVDLPDALAFRQAFATEEAPSHQVAGSILKTDWFDTLPVAQSSSILFAAEGILSFFDGDQLAAMVSQLRARFPGATLVADVMGEANRARAGKRLESIGAPAHWFITDEQDIVNLGLSSVKVWPLIAQYPQRWGAEVAHWATDPILRNSSVVFEAKL